MRREYEVIVAGAGPAGSSTAILLARMGVRVALLDRAVFPRPKTCAGGITARAWSQAPADLSPVVERKIDTVRMDFVGRRSFEFSHPDTLVYMTQRHRLDTHLVRTAEAAGADLIESALVQSVDNGTDTVVLETSLGRLRSRVIVGADGANSLISRSVSGESYERMIAVEDDALAAASVLDVSPWSGTLALRLGQSWPGYGWVFPKGDHLNFGYYGPATDAITMRSALDGLARAYGLGEHPRVRLRGQHLPVCGHGRPFSKGRVLLVGDAAGLVDPLSGEGIYGAFVSARLATDAATRYLRGQRANLADYDAAVRRTLTPDIEAARLLRDASSCLPALSFELMRRWSYLRRALCQIVVGERTYVDLIRAAGPLTVPIRAMAALGRRRERARRAAVGVSSSANRHERERLPSTSRQIRP